MDFLAILRRSSPLTLVNAVGIVLNFLATSYVANQFGAEKYGSVTAILLVVSYAGFTRVGFFEAGQRETITAMGKGDLTSSVRSQNIGFSAELAWSGALGALIAAQSLRADTSILRLGFLSGAVLFLAQSVTRMFGGLFLARQEMGLYTMGYVIRAVVQPPLLVGMGILSGPSGLILAPMFVECGIAFVCFSFRHRIGLRWRIELPVARELAVVGFPLAVSAAVYWIYRLAGQTCIALLLTATALGIYGFASKIVDQIARFFGDFANLLMPKLWVELAKVKSPREMIGAIYEVTVLLVMLACFGCNLTQAVASHVTVRFLPRFAASVPVLEVLSFNLVLLAIPMTAGLILDSSAVNQQTKHVRIWLFGGIVNYLANLWTLSQGWSVMSIAWNDLFVQFLVICLLFRAVHPYLFSTFRAAAFFCGSLMTLLLSAFAVHNLFRFLRLLQPSGGELRGLLLRTTFATVVWGTCYFVFSRYRKPLLATVEKL